MAVLLRFTVCVKNHHFKGTLPEMLVSKIVVKVMFKIYSENSPGGDLPIVIYVWYLCSLFNPESLNFTKCMKKIRGGLPILKQT